jgi:hypothetical protein
LLLLALCGCTFNEVTPENTASAEVTGSSEITFLTFSDRGHRNHGSADRNRSFKRRYAGL